MLSLFFQYICCSEYMDSMPFKMSSFANPPLYITYHVILMRGSLSQCFSLYSLSALYTSSPLTYKHGRLCVVLVEGVGDDAGVGEREDSDESLGEGGRQGLGHGAAEAGSQQGGTGQQHQQGGGHGWGVGPRGWGTQLGGL